MSFRSETNPAAPTAATAASAAACLYRWGSCSGNGCVYFHWKLLQLPVRLIDYVIVHELTHLIHHHHTPEFWSCVERALPDWRKQKEELVEFEARHSRFAR